MCFGKLHGRLSLALVLACGISLTACSGTTTVPGDAGSLQSPSASVNPVPSMARDGSSLLPTNVLSSCGELGPDRIREVLGDAAAEIQPSETSGSVDPSGTRRESCVYSLDSGRTTTHAVVVEVTTFGSIEEIAGSAPFAAMTNSVEVPDLPGQARFAVIELSGSTEYALVMANGPKLLRLIVSLPTSSWTAADGLAKLKEMVGPDKA
ncbi:DUF3558 domain-containing protein [Arthrobacter sp. RHLT1-20]